jgi:hypothetical protein
LVGASVGTSSSPKAASAAANCSRKGPTIGGARPAARAASTAPARRWTVLAPIRPHHRCINLG